MRALEKCVLFRCAPRFAFLFESFVASWRVLTFWYMVLQGDWSYAGGGFRRICEAHAESILT
jgi:hypothetical protein